MYYAAIKNKQIEISTSLAAASRFTGLSYNTLVYQFIRKQRMYYERGETEIYATGGIVRIDRPQYKDAFK